MVTNMIDELNLDIFLGVTKTLLIRKMPMAAERTFEYFVAMTQDARRKACTYSLGGDAMTQGKMAHRWVCFSCQQAETTGFTTKPRPLSMTARSRTCRPIRKVSRLCHSASSVKQAAWAAKDQGQPAASYKKVLATLTEGDALAPRVVDNAPQYSYRVFLQVAVKYSSSTTTKDALGLLGCRRARERKNQLRSTTTSA